MTPSDPSPELVARTSGSSFLPSFLALEPERREALTAVYAFCRVVDDAVDEAPDPVSARRALDGWRQELEAALAGHAQTAIGRAVAAAVARYRIDPAPLRELIDGVALDIEPTRLRTVADMERYCYLVAATVGLACLPVFGATSEGSRRYATELGHALQLVNILRDLRSDGARGQVRVAEELLAGHGVDPDWLRGQPPPAACADDGPLDRLSADLAERARERFARADAALPPQEFAALLAPRIMAAIYRALLNRIRRHRGRLPARPVRVPRWQKLWLAWRERRRRGRA